jgi:hypothetical protein
MYFLATVVFLSGQIICEKRPHIEALLAYILLMSTEKSFLIDP